MQYYSISSDELGTGARIPLRKLGDSGEVFYEMALEMLEVIAENPSAVMIIPVGPTGQYPIFVRLVNARGISLRQCCFINMDEYLTESGDWLPEENPLSFRGYMRREVYEKIRPDLLMPEGSRVFPDPRHPERIGEIIEKRGGVDAVFGGIGINGHLAFNEPRPELSPEEFALLSSRVQEISPETHTINSAGSLGGALEIMPRLSVTVGMKEILGAKKIRLGVFRDWHRAVIRRAAYGEISSAFPATLLQNHPDACIIANAVASAAPL